MKPVLEETYFLSAGDANAEGRLSLTALTTKLIEIATVHANRLGIGNPDMAHLNAGWVLSRLTLEMFSYPQINASYVIKTWIESLNRHFSTRCFSIETPDGEIYGYSRSIWLVMDASNHTNFGTSHLMLPPEMIEGKSVPIPLQQKHICIAEPGKEEECGKKQLISTHAPFPYTFQFCDLDFYRHVNTVRYVGLLLNQFSLKEHDENTVERMELSFLHEAKYGMKTILLRSDSKENSLHSSFELKDTETGTSILFARINRKTLKA